MRSPCTANDDQPGPTFRRHSSFGGAAIQSALMRRLRITPSRSGPRKPGHSAGGIAAGGGAGAVVGGAIVAVVGEVAVVVGGVDTIGGAATGAAGAIGAGATGSGTSVAWASNFCSAVGVQRHAS